MRIAHAYRTEVGTYFQLVAVLLEVVRDRDLLVVLLDRKRHESLGCDLHRVVLTLAESFQQAVSGQDFLDRGLHRGSRHGYLLWV